MTPFEKHPTLVPLFAILLLLLLASAATVRGSSSLVEDGTAAQLYPRSQVPNYEYIERGFDAMLGNPKTTPQGDLGFRDWIFEATPTVKASRRPSCDFSSNTIDMKRSTELQSSFEQGIEVEGSYAGVSFSASIDYKQQSNEMRTSQSVIVEATAFCTAWDAWLPTIPTLRANFKKAIMDLPTTYSASAYRRFIQQFGTHYAYKLDLGGRSVLSSYFSSEKYSKLVSKQINVKLAVSAKFAIASGKASSSTSVSSSELNTVESSQSTVRRYMLGGATRDNFDQWAQTVPQNPIPVMYKLRELTELFTDQYVNGASGGSFLEESSEQKNAQIPQFTVSKTVLNLGNLLVAASTSLQQKKANFARALREYMEELRGPSFEVPIDYYPTRWPSGSYCLPTQGSCSGGATSGWSTGSRYQDCEDSNGNTHVGEHAPAFGGGKGGVQMSFCCHLYEDQHPGAGMQWPHGSYCIFKRGSCPYGFSSGGRSFDDEDGNNKNWVSGTLPDGHYDKNTRYEFCCRQSQAPNIAVRFPIYGEFWLARKGGVCQQVKGMLAREGYVRWDNEDGNNQNSLFGTLPDGAYDKNTVMHFCRYTPLD